VQTYLYLTRHGEADDHGVLTPAGLRQAALLGARLAEVPLAAVHHGPLPRAARTAALVAEHLPGVALHATELAGDFLPWTGPTEQHREFLAGFSAEERQQGPILAGQAVQRFSQAGGHHLVVTHNFLLAWLVRDALGAPPERWLGLNHANAALTVIRYGAGEPPRLLVYNDTGHLPADLRWTGFPPEFQV
jgi:probable phosphoglycerate mutase